MPLLIWRQQGLTLLFLPCPAPSPSPSTTPSAPCIPPYGITDVVYIELLMCYINWWKHLIYKHTGEHWKEAVHRIGEESAHKHKRHMIMESVWSTTMRFITKFKLLCIDKNARINPQLVHKQWARRSLGGFVCAFVHCNNTRDCLNKTRQLNTSSGRLSLIDLRN